MSQQMLETSEMHLTEDQIDDALIGDLAVTAAAHLSGCKACTTRVAQAEMPLASFKAVTTAWSERRSATMPTLAPQRVGLGARGRLMAWSTALSVMIVAGVAVPVLVHKENPADTAAARTVQAPAAVQAATSVGEIAKVNAPEAVGASGSSTSRDESSQERLSQERISKDNAMLQDINRELDASSASSVLTLEQPRGPLAKPQIVNE